MVHLDEPRLQLLVEHYVEAKDLEAQLILKIVRLAGAVDLPECGLSRNHGLDDEIVDLSLQLFYIMSASLQ